MKHIQCPVLHGYVSFLVRDSALYPHYVAESVTGLHVPKPTTTQQLLRATRLLEWAVATITAERSTVLPYSVQHLADQGLLNRDRLEAFSAACGNLLFELNMDLAEDTLGGSAVPVDAEGETVWHTKEQHKRGFSYTKLHLAHTQRQVLPALNSASSSIQCCIVRSCSPQRQAQEMSLVGECVAVALHKLTLLQRYWRPPVIALPLLLTEQDTHILRSVETPFSA